MTTTVSASIDKRLASRLTRRAKVDQTSKSNVLKKALTEYLEEQDLVEEYNNRKPLVVREITNGEYMTLGQLEKSLKKK